MLSLEYQKGFINLLDAIQEAGHPGKLDEEDDSWEEDKQDFDDWGSQQEDNFLNEPCGEF